MARALMTPDELRRMDNDLCIIFEKGIKPVKANKFYYFKHKAMVNSLDKVKVSHNDIEELDRGTWRKFNPYNPWVEDTTEKQAENLKVESLDDLFDETPSKKEEKPLATVGTINNNNSNVEKKQGVSSLDSMFEDVSPVSDVKTANVQQENDEDSYDLQRELEAKFDELFGPMDD